MTEVIVNTNTSIVEVINEPIVIEIGGFGSSSGGGIGAIANVGAGTGVFKQIASGTAQFKTLLAGSNITLTPAADTITIAATNASLAALLSASNDADGNTITNLGAPVNPTDAARLQDIPTSLPPSGAAGGDLSGTYPNPSLATVIGLTPGAYGSATHYPTISIDSKGRVTVASQLALPTSLPPSGSAGGDLTGTYPNPTINNTAVTYAKIQNVTADRLLGRVSTTGSVQEIQLGAGLEFDGTTLQVNEFDPLGWLTDGNSVSEVKSIGTLTPFDFPIIANNVEVMRIKASGFVNFTGVSQDDLLTKILTIDSSGDLYWRDVASISSSALTSFSDSSFEVYNDLDATKTIALNLSGITTATTRTYTAPNASGVFALTTNVNGVVEMNEINGSLTTSQITDAAVTYPKIQNVSANSFLANITGSPTVVQEVATNRIPLFGSAITGTPSATTYLRGDGTWDTPSSIGSSFEDSAFEIHGSADVSKIAKFEVDGFTTATTRTFTLPDASGTVALTSDLSGWLTGTLTGNVSVSGTDVNMSFTNTESGTGTNSIILRSSNSGGNDTELKLQAYDFYIRDVTSGYNPIYLSNPGVVNIRGFNVNNNVTIDENADNLVGISQTSGKKLEFTDSYTILNLGSDATGDTYYRNSSGYLTRLGIGSSGQVLTVSGGGIPSWATPSGGSSVLSDITAATGSNTINSGANHQIWDWNSLTSGTGMSFRSASPNAASNTLQVVSIEKSGANATSSQTTTALNVSNTSTGTSATNVAGRFTASGGTNNYALDIDGGIRISDNDNSHYYTIAKGALTANRTLTWPSMSSNAYIVGVNSTGLHPNRIVYTANALGFAQTSANLTYDGSLLAVNNQAVFGATSITSGADFDVNGNVIFRGSSRYLNFGTTAGSSGYGFRDNAGVLQYKNTGGNWFNIGIGFYGFQHNGTSDGKSKFFTVDFADGFVANIGSANRAVNLFFDDNSADSQDRSIIVHFYINLTKSDGSDSTSAEYVVAFRNDGGTVSKVGTEVEIMKVGNATPTFSFSVATHPQVTVTDNGSGGWNYRIWALVARQ